MKELKFKQFEVNKVDEITLLSVEEAKKLPKSILACGDWWWLRSPGNYQFFAASVSYDGDVCEFGSSVYIDYTTVRPAFKISNLESEIGDKIMVGKTWCTVIDEGLVLADYPVCRHRFDSKSNNWETSELKSFVNSDEFKAMILGGCKKMKELKFKQFEVNEVDKITLLTIEEAKKLPESILACGDWWWLRSPGDSQYFAAYVSIGGDVDEHGCYVNRVDLAVRPAFRISNLESKIGEPVRIGKTWCTVIDEGLVLADYTVCKHRFDSESNDWETSELKSFVNSDEFKAML